MDDHDHTFDRRTYLACAGATGVAATLGLAGCLEDAGDGGNGSEPENEEDDGNGGEPENEDDGNDTGNETGNGAGDTETDDNETGDDNESEETEAGGEIVAGTAPGFPPFEMNEDGELVGFDIDLLEAVVEETDYELTGWEELEFDSLQAALENGNIDVIAAAMTITEERRESLAFSEPYYSADQSVLVQSGADFAPEALEDLEGREIGAQSGTTGEEIVQGLIEDGVVAADDYTSFDNYVLAVEDLERGLLDAVVLDEPVGATFEADRDVEVAFVSETDEEYGFAVRQDDENLRDALSEGIAAVEESSEYEDITRTWFGGGEGDGNGDGEETNE